MNRVSNTLIGTDSLHKKGYYNSLSIPDALSIPIEDNNPAALTYAIKQSGCPNIRTLNELLVHAIRHNATETITYLVELKASPLSKICFDVLHKSKFFPSAQRLVENGSLDINTDFEELGTFLIQAVKRNNKSHVEYCLWHGADPNYGTYASRWSPLATAAEYDADLDIMDLLIDAGAKLNSSDALHTTAENGRYQMVEYLINKGADVNVIGFQNSACVAKACEAGTALHFAVDANSVEVARLLIEKGADMEIPDADGRGAILRAMEKGMKEVRVFLEEVRREREEEDPGASEERS